MTLAFLIKKSLVLVEYGYGKPGKPSEYINILNIFTNIDTNAKLYEYPTFRQEIIARQLVKDVFKVVISEKFVNSNKVIATKKILINQLLNPGIIDKIENANTDKANKKSHLIKYIYNNKGRNLMLI